MKKVSAIKRLSTSTSFPLTSTQAGFFFLHQMNPASPILNMVRLDDVKGAINEPQLKSSIEQNIRRHGIYRTLFKEVEGQAVQVVLAPNEIHVDIGKVDISHIAPKNQKEELLKRVNELGAIPFDLQKPPLIRAYLIRLGHEHLVLLRVIHHIVSDFKTNLLFLRDISETYESLGSNRPVPLPEPEFQFGDYAAWEKENINDENIRSQLEYWKKHLSDCPDFLHLPLDRPRPSVIGSNFKIESIELPFETWEKGKALAKNLGLSIFQFNIATFLLFLHRWSGDEDICVGSNIDFRKIRGLPNLMGPGINHFVLRSHFKPDISFKDFSEQIAETAKKTYSNTDVSVDRLVQLVSPKRSLGYSPLFQVMFDIWHKDVPVKNRFLQFSRMDYAWLHGNVDISARITEGNEKITIWFRYNADLFEPDTIQRMLKAFRNLYEESITNPDKKISNLDLLSTEDSLTYISTICGSTASYESCQGIQEYFERQADRTPQALALDFESKTLTYQELEAMANQLAHYLREHGVKRNVFVGLLMDRSAEMFIGILGTLKAGGAYVPLDPTYPMERLDFLFEEIEAPVILTQATLAKCLPEKASKSQHRLLLDREWDKEVSSYPISRPSLLNTMDDIAYMIYTSGSTGKPKGCPNTHRNIGNYLQWVKTKHPMSVTDKLLFRTPYTFDVSVPEILYPLLCGASVVVAAPGKHGDISYIVNLIREKKITEIGFVPSTLQVFLEENGVKNCTSLKIVTAIGEALPPETVKKFYECLPQAKLINSYGPTEAAVAVTFWDCSPSDLSNVPIGYPIPNNLIYILNESGVMCPVGVYGEIFIGGTQVANGYWKRPELTRERFVKDPFAKDPKARMYKTGDRGRFLTNGSIEYQGRIDFQVKVRGFRIELGEIEAVLLEHEAIKQAAVIVKKLHGERNPTGIVAYIVKKDNGIVNIASVTTFLKSKLPDYMVPSGFVILDELPVITSGKVNRKALMERQDEFQLGEEESGEKYSPPENETEKCISTVWGDVLQTAHIGRTTNYFALGGDSLSLVRILQRLGEYNFGLNLEDLYSHQTIAELASLVIERKHKGSSNNSSLPTIKAIAQTAKETRFPLSFVQEGRRNLISNRNSAEAIHMINDLSGPLDVPAFRRSIEKLIERQWALKTKFLVDGHEAYQIICEPEIEYFFQKDFRAVPSDKVEETIINEIYKNLAEEFDLYKSPMIKCFLHRVANEQYFLVIRVHHLVFDGVALINLQEEIQELYSAEIEKRTAKLPELIVQYVDYAVWEKETFLDKSKIKKRIQYWQKILTDLPVLNLPLDFPRSEAPGQNESPVSENRGATALRIIEKPLIDKLLEFGKKQNSTLYLTILTAIAELLHGVSGQSEIIFNETLGQRPSQMADTIGHFMSILPLRINYSKESSLLEILSQIKERSFSSQTHLIPTKILWDVPRSEKDQKAFERIGVLVNFTSDQRNPLILPRINSEYVELEGGGGSIGDIYIHFSVRKDQIDYFISGDPHLFLESSIALMANKFEKILAEMVEKSY